MGFGSGRGRFGKHGVTPPHDAERLGWRVPFSEEYKANGIHAHLLVVATSYVGLAYRLCAPGHIINPALACRKDIAVLDEIPASYKDIDAVMLNQSDLVEVLHTLKQVVCVKGA